MEFLNLILKDGTKIKVQKGSTLKDIIVENNIKSDLPIMLGEVNGSIYELNYEIEEGGSFDIIDTSESIGSRTYARTLQFVLIKAVLDLFPSSKIYIEHSIDRGLVGNIYKEESLNIDDIPIIEDKMVEIIEADIPINKVSMPKEEAIKIFMKYKMDDKVRLLKHLSLENVNLYELDGRYDYFYGPMACSTGVLNIFKLDYYEPGFLLRFPVETNPYNIKRFVNYKKLRRIFQETEKWGKILEVADVGSLNDKVENGDIINIIRVSEAFHEKKVAYIADKIHEDFKKRLVLIAGPSSSGKTTFTERLGIQLRANGLHPISISLDDYFLERKDTPKDENGEYDFESIYALDLELFNHNLKDLIEGKEVEIPRFNFKTGSREWKGEKKKLSPNGILLVEGIHGLNEMLTSTIPKENKFKIYISALTQLNVDSHNRISTTDVRIIRRIVRDSLSRGYGAEDTLKMWPSIRKGEEKNIFVFQEEADVMFNSSLVYELCVLKKYALEELTKIKEDSPVYYEALRLISFLSFFKDVDERLTPENSILREFIGGSCFYKY